MNVFGIVDPRSKTQPRLQTFASLETAARSIGLDVSEAGFGTYGDLRNILVDQYGLFEPVEKTGYFAIDKGLFAGPAVLYATDPSGAIRDLLELPAVRFFDNAAQIEREIEQETLTQPSMSFKGQVFWVWPQPKPDLFPF